MTYIYTSPRGDGEPRNPTTGNGEIITHEGTTPRGGYNSGPDIDAPGKTWYLYAKPGVTLNFYSDGEGKVKVGPFGGKGGQDNAPTRSNEEIIGPYQRETTPQGFMLVSWVNKWWQNGTIFKKGAYKSENLIAYVKMSEVTISEKLKITPDTAQTIADSKAAAELQAAISGGSGTAASGIDSTTLGIAAVGAALFLGKKKKRK